MLPYPSVRIALSVCLKRQESWDIAWNLANTMSPLCSAEPYLCHRGRLEERGEKSAQSKVFVKKRPDPKLEADYKVPKTFFGIRGLRPRLGISKQNRTFGIESVQSVWNGKNRESSRRDYGIKDLEDFNYTTTNQEAIPQFYCFGEHCENKSAQIPAKQKKWFCAKWQEFSLRSTWGGPRVLHTAHSSTAHHTCFKSNKDVAKSRLEAGSQTCPER